MGITKANVTLAKARGRMMAWSILNGGFVFGMADL